MTESVKPNEVIIPKKENISGSNEDEEKPSVKPENQPEKPVDKEQSGEVKTGDTTSSIMIFGIWQCLHCISWRVRYVMYRLPVEDKMKKETYTDFYIRMEICIGLIFYVQVTF